MGSAQDANLHQRLSQAHAALQQPLAPDSVEFLRARGTLATWVADYHRAQDSYRRLSALQPADHDALLNLARVSAWAGRTDAAVDAYSRYLRVEPGTSAIWIELAKAESWRGNYSAALETLEKYRTRFGADEAYSREVAGVLARSGRPGKALDALEPMLRQHPDDYYLNLTRTIALAMQRRAREANDSLDTLRHLQPNSGDTQAAERVVRQPRRPRPGLACMAIQGTEVQACAARHRAVVSRNDGRRRIHARDAHRAGERSRTDKDARMRSIRRSGSLGRSSSA